MDNPIKLVDSDVGNHTIKFHYDITSHQCAIVIRRLRENV